LDLDACGVPIVAFSDVQTAVDQAAVLLGPQVIGLPAGDMAWPETLVIDECGGTECEVAGMTLKPASPGSASRLMVSRPDLFAIHVETGRVTLEGFTILDAAYGVYLKGSRSSVIRRLRFNNENEPPLELVVVAAAASTVTSSLFQHKVMGSQSGTAIAVRSVPDVQVVMNVIRGPFLVGVEMSALGGDGFVDNNTVLVEVQSSFWGSTAYKFNSVRLCFRNNVIHGGGMGGGAPLAFDTTSTTTDESGGCALSPSARNVLSGSYTRCVGDDCTTLCPSSEAGPLCSTFASASLNFQDPGLCPTPGSVLLNAGVDVGLDMVDLAPATFLGSGPEIGAREAGTSRVFGDLSASCMP
jgi:hypothetical protein